MVNSVSTKDIGSYTLQYCVKLINFLNEHCKSFTVVIHDLSYLTSNKPPWFKFGMSWKETNPPDFVYVYKVEKIAVGLIQCVDLETNQEFLDISFLIKTDDEIPWTAWAVTTAQNVKTIVFAD